MQSHLQKVNFRTPSVNNKFLACLVERVGREYSAELLDAVEEDPLHLAGLVDVVLGRRRRLHLLLRVHGVDHVVGRVDQRLQRMGTYLILDYVSRIAELRSGS